MNCQCKTDDRDYSIWELQYDLPYHGWVKGAQVRLKWGYQYVYELINPGYPDDTALFTFSPAKCPEVFKEVAKNVPRGTRINQQKIIEMFFAD